MLDDQALVHLTQPENCGPPLTVSFANLTEAACFFKEKIIRNVRYTVILCGHAFSLKVIY